MRRYCVVALVVTAVAAAMVGSSSVEALAFSAGPGWVVSSVAQPTNFAVGDNTLCARETNFLCDRYVVTLTNIGSEPTNAPVVIADTVPVGLKPSAMSGRSLETGFPLESNGFGWTCNAAKATCVYNEAVASGGTLEVVLEVKVEAGAQAGPVTNIVRVSGGGAQSVSTSQPSTLANTVNGPPAAFGISAFGFAAHDASGQLDARAADHPFDVTSTINFNTTVTAEPNGELIPASVESPRNIVVYLPLGFLGDPTAAGQCTELQLKSNGNRKTHCPATSRVGSIILFAQNIVTGTVFPEEYGGSTSAIYNMVPDHGYPAQFGFTYAGVPIQLYGSVVQTPSGYALRVASPGLPTTIHVEGAALTFFGDPNMADGNPSASQAFLTNPDNCSAGPLRADVQADSWNDPARWVSEQAVAYPGITGCNLLQFEPQIEMHPEVTQAEEPTGYEIKIKVRQNPEEFPILATPQLKNVTMTLPEGMNLSPGGAVGLTGCEATGPNGIDMPTNLPENKLRTPTEVGEGEAIGQEGMSQLTPGHCPQSSQIGTVKITTPALEKPLDGHLYVAAPQCGTPNPCTAADATNGNLFGLYLEAAGSGVVVKLRGTASVNPTTGRITAKFLENPQLPVSEVALKIEGGASSPLANPRQCGQALANGDLAPWSSPITPDAIVGGGFTVDWDGQGGPCPAGLPFAPGFNAGVTNVAAGRDTTLTATITRGDRQQDIGRLQVTTPPGLLGMLAKVPLCGEPLAAEGKCAAASQIGTTTVAVGPGPAPLWVKGRVYLTGPYGGAPFGLSIVVPAVAGPFNLGDVTVRARIGVDEETSAITVTSDPLPQVLDGVPLRIETVNVAIEREGGFMFNPTSCTGKLLSGKIESTQGTAVAVSSPFAVEGCKNLPFKPTFAASTGATTTKARGASLDVKLGSGQGQANIATTVVSLPKQLPARLTTLQQACPEATFAANPAACPAGSEVGFAKAITPVLSEPAIGPAYLVSHGGAAFPDLVFILQAEGLRLDLTGNTGIKNGITTSSFNAVPDVPITSFEVTLPQGPHSALGTDLPAKAKGSFCSAKLVMPTTLTGQNGAQVKQSTKIVVVGCPKAKAAKARKAKARRKK